MELHARSAREGEDELTMWRFLRIAAVSFFLVLLTGAGMTYAVAVHPHVQPCLAVLQNARPAQLPEQIRAALIAGVDPAFRAHLAVRSRLTNQLVRSSCPVRSSNLRRIAVELALGSRLAWRYSHDEIVDVYASHLYFGTVYGQQLNGIDMAAHSLFNVEAQRLSIADAALLAALSHAPNPLLRRPEKLRERRDLVLDRMADASTISRSEAESAKQQPLPQILRNFYAVADR